MKRRTSGWEHCQRHRHPLRGDDVFLYDGHVRVL